MPRYAILEAPSVLGQIPTQPGVARLPDAMLRAGLVERLSARRAGRIESPPYSAHRDPDTLMMNAAAIGEYSQGLAAAVAESLERDEFHSYRSVTSSCTPIATP